MIDSHLLNRGVVDAEREARAIRDYVESFHGGKAVRPLGYVCCSFLRMLPSEQRH
jgi:hypothetical protein